MPEKKRMSKTDKWAIVVIAVIVVFAAAILLLQSGWLYNSVSVGSVDDDDYSTAEFNYYYMSAYNNFVSQFGEYGGYVVDTTKPMDEQMYMYATEEDYTYDDYFTEMALASIKMVSVMYDDAVEAGYTLTDLEKEALEAQRESFASEALSGGFSDPDDYAAYIYGLGVDTDFVIDQIARQYLASRYADDQAASYSYDAAALESYYQEHRNELDSITLKYAFISGAADEENGISAEDAMAAAREQAAEILAAADDAASFGVQVTKELDADATSVTINGTTVNNYFSATEGMVEWLLDDSRTANDIASFENASGIYLVCFEGRDDNHYKTVGVRHILVKAVADENGEYTEEALAEAEAKAQEIYDEYLAGDKTEESFAALAEQYSEDEGSKTNGGLYTGIYKGQMVQEFNDFAFGDRTVGDTAVIYGESAYYAGYHVVFFAGEDADLYSDSLADSALRSADYDAWETALVDAAVTSESTGLRNPLEKMSGRVLK